MSSLREQLSHLPKDVQAMLEENHFDSERLLAHAERLIAESSGSGSSHSNRVSGEVTLARPEDLLVLPGVEGPEHQRLQALGEEALRSGQVALVVLAGGMATRMGGVVKSLVDALPGKSFLDLRLGEVNHLRERYGAPVPLWLMTSEATDGKIREALGSRLGVNGVATFRQHVSLRLTPDANLFSDETGRVSEHAPGHGDLVDALRDSGLLQSFVESGGRVVTMTNIDNLGGGVTPLVIGAHLAHGLGVSCEVVPKLGSDRGGIPVRHAGRPVVLEEFRLPEDFDPASVPVFNTNTFHFDARALLGSNVPWTYFTVEKQVGGKTAIQFERLIGQVTESLDTRFLLCPRTGPGSRFLPVKDHKELGQRQLEIAEVARYRHMIVSK